MKKTIEAIITAIAIATPAIAEVMDKEPSLQDIWGSAIVCSALGFFASRFKPKFTAFTAIAALFVFGGVVSEIHDPSVGKDILAEAGKTYHVQVYAAIAIIVASHVIGFILRKVKQQKTESTHNQKNSTDQKSVG